MACIVKNVKGGEARNSWDIPCLIQDSIGRKLMRTEAIAGVESIEKTRHSGSSRCLVRVDNRRHVAPHVSFGLVVGSLCLCFCI